jgi:DNA invertase Pin-like site-specific DNA recombinase
MKTALYARVSTAKGEQDPEVQLAELRAWARRLGHEVVAEHADRVSGTKGADDRPALADALRGAHERRYDVLLVWALDRVSRGGISATADILARLRRSGVAVKSLKEEWLDTSAPGIGELLTAVFAWVAQQERERIRERVVAGLDRAKRRGVRLGRPEVVVDVARARQIIERTASVRAAARALRVAPGTIRRALAHAGRRPAVEQRHGTMP